MFVLGGGDYPSYTVATPATWHADGSFVQSGPGVLGVSVWDVGRVPSDPCSWKGKLRDPGRSVDALVSALEAQRYRHASKPVPVTIGGYSGTHLEWSVPSHWKVSGDSDFKGCDDPGNGHHDFVSWMGNGGGERYEQVAGQVDRLWVLDVHGQRLVIDATYSPDTTQTSRRQEDTIVKSLRFQQPSG